MMRTWGIKRSFWTVLAAAVLFTLLWCGIAQAVAVNGSCGENVTWSFDPNSPPFTLNISGSGPMDNYAGMEDVPWHDYIGSIRSIQIGQGVTGIGSFAFSGCSGAARVGIPDGLQSIGASAFSNCSELTGITLSSAVASVGDHAFASCGKLGNVLIYNPSVTIGEAAFLDCGPNLVIKSYPGSTAETYAAANGLTVTAWPVSGRCGENLEWSYDMETKALSITGTGEMDDCFINPPGWKLYKNEIHTVLVGEGVTSIGASAFDSCNYLTGITLPEGLTRIGSSAFQYCIILEDLTFPSSLTSIAGNAFYFCWGLKEVVIPCGVTRINANTFRECMGLKSVIIPDSVTYIGSYAFSTCSALKSITIPDSVTEIDEGAFDYAVLSGVEIPRSVTAIGRIAFSDCQWLTEATVWNPNVSFGEEAFAYGNPDLVIVGYPDSTAQVYAADAGITFRPLEIPDPDFFLPGDLTEIGADAFIGIQARAVVIPKNVAEITGNPFANSQVQVIYGYEGSAAETFSESFGYCFVPLYDE